MNEPYDWLMLIGGVCFMLIPLPMMVVTWLYVNKTPRKQRLIELGYGTNNDWYRGKKIDFVDANYIVALVPAAAFGMIFRKKIFKMKLKKLLLVPNLHNDENYLKVKREFPFFYYWILTMFVLVVSGMTVLSIGMGIDKGWFHF